jgi:hypothetical protein
MAGKLFLARRTAEPPRFLAQNINIHCNLQRGGYMKGRDAAKGRLRDREKIDE